MGVGSILIVTTQSTLSGGILPGKQSPAPLHGEVNCGGDWSGYKVFRNAISCRRSSGFRFSPKVWPGIARASMPSGLNPPGT